MNLVHKLRQLVSTRRKPPIKNCSGLATIKDVCQGGTICQPEATSSKPDGKAIEFSVSRDEYRLLMSIKENYRNGLGTFIKPPNPNKAAYEAAKQVKEGKHLNEIQTLIETGFYIRDE